MKKLKNNKDECRQLFSFQQKAKKTNGIYIKKNIEENVVIFSLLLSLKMNEKNKRKREGKSSFVISI